MHREMCVYGSSECAWVEGVLCIYITHPLMHTPPLPYRGGGVCMHVHGNGRMCVYIYEGARVCTKQQEDMCT